MRGEYIRTQTTKEEYTELPPRARRIQLIQFFLRRPRGTTSAYAENTIIAHHQSAEQWNYLRVRGEYCTIIAVALSNPELPPRTRRIRVGFDHALGLGGTTSAYAENTPDTDSFKESKGNYLRVRGEYRPSTIMRVVLPELPPRTRRIQHRLLMQASVGGTTSAYAENTL